MTAPTKQQTGDVTSGISSVLAYLAGPRALALALIIFLAAFGWIWLILGVGTMTSPSGAVYLGPGMDLLGAGNFEALLAWCAERLAVPDHGTHGTGLDTILVAFAMWSAMVAAMMLPTAYPMIATYSEIADTAMRGGQQIISVFVLLAGYTSVWLSFAAIATIAQIMLFEWGALEHGMTPAVAWLAPASLILAGAYQFTQMKQACLTKCRQPFTFFFANWRGSASDVFSLGLHQGMLCLGCCWALMIAMFATGLMNLVWMAILAIIMLLEKILPKPNFIKTFSGIGFIGWGIWLAYTALTGA